jgi:hypothetical protein
LREKTLTILDLPRLQAIGVFNPNYLHFLHTRSGTTSADIERERVANGSPASVINRHANQPELRSGPPY